MADHNLFTHKAFRQTAQSHALWATGSRGSQSMCGTKGGGKPIGLADALPRERTLSGNVDTLEAHRCGLTLSGQRGRGFPPNSINLFFQTGQQYSAVEYTRASPVTRKVCAFAPQLVPASLCIMLFLVFSFCRNFSMCSLKVKYQLNLRKQKLLPY
jgi:hypothetical protein